MGKRVLMLSWRLQGEQGRQIAEMVSRYGCELIPAPPEHELSRAALLDLVTNADGLIMGVEHRADEELMDKGPRLRVISSFGIGYNHIDLEAARTRGIVVANCAGCNEHNVTELVIGMMIMLVKHLRESDEAVRSGRWRRPAQTPVDTELWGKTLGIVGLGRIGKSVALVARTLGMQVIASDIVWDLTFASQNQISYVPLDELLTRSDVVTLHCPFTSQTHHLINERTLRQMRPSAYLINAARGAIVDGAALTQALREGWVAGAGLDVFEQEPPSDIAWIDVPNVVLSPHIGGSSRESLARMFHLSITNVANVLDGLPPHNQVN